MSIVLSVILWVLLGWITSYFAQQKGRDPTIWFMVGMFLGLIGLLLLFLLPPVTAEGEQNNNAASSNNDNLFTSKGTSTETIEVPPSAVSVQPECTTFDWFYLDKDRQQQGPIPFLDLKKRWIEEQISRLTYVWRDGMESWKKIEEIPDLLNALNP